MDQYSWTPAQIDEIDFNYLTELIEHKSKQNDPKEKRKAKWRNQKVVPIDAVF